MAEADIDNRVNTGLALQQAGALDAFSWQLYDTVVDLATAKWRLGMLIQAGLPASKVTVEVVLAVRTITTGTTPCLAYMRDIKASLRARASRSVRQRAGLPRITSGPPT